MSNPPYGEQPSDYPDGQPGGQGYPGQPGGQGYPDGQGYPGQPSSKYGTDPYAPGTYGGPMAEPKKFSLLKTFTLVSLAIYVLSSLPGLFVSGDDAQQEMINAIEQQGMSQQEAADAADMFAGVFTAFIWVTLLIGVALYLLVFFGLKKNKNWARVLGIVFAIIGIVFTLLGLIGVDLVTLALSLVHVAVAIYWLVLAFSTEVKTYLKQFTR